MPNVESIEILNDGYITVRGDGLPARHALITSLDYAPNFTAGFTASDPSAITMTGRTVSHIGLTITIAATVAYASGWALGFFGTTTLSATTGVTYNAAGGVFEVNFASAYAANQAGLVCGLYVGAYSASTNGAARPTTGLWIETIPGTGVDFTNVPLISFITSGAGTKSAIMFELGNNSAGKTVTTGSGGMFYNQTIHIIANNTEYYIPISTVEGTYTTAYPVALSYTSGPALTITQATVGNDARGIRFLLTQATPAMTDGYGIFETELTVSGTATGAIAVASTWLNLGGAAETAVGNYVFVHSDGIWDGGATIQGNIAWAKYQCLLASNPSWCSIWELNFSGANSEIDAIFNVNSLILALGYQAGTPTKVAVGSIPFCSEAGGQLRYIYLYDEADAD